MPSINPVVATAFVDALDHSTDGSSHMATQSLLNSHVELGARTLTTLDDAGLDIRRFLDLR